jgi:hypothetical protein
LCNRARASKTRRDEKLSVHFFKEFADKITRLGKGAAAGGGGGVNLALVAIHEPGSRTEPAAALHAVEERIDSAGTEAVAVTAELVDDAKAEDRFLGGVVQNVETDKPDVEVLVGGGAAGGGRRFAWHGLVRV